MCWRHLPQIFTISHVFFSLFIDFIKFTIFISFFPFFPIRPNFPEFPKFHRFTIWFINLSKISRFFQDFLELSRFFKIFPNLYRFFQNFLFFFQNIVNFQDFLQILLISINFPKKSLFFNYFFNFPFFWKCCRLFTFPNFSEVSRFYLFLSIFPKLTFFNRLFLISGKLSWIFSMFPDFSQLHTFFYKNHTFLLSLGYS